MTRILEDCDCGCNTPVATNPRDMLEFLYYRFNHAGVAECIASGYAKDIEDTLDEFYPNWRD